MSKVTLHTLSAKTERGEKLTMITAYDYPTARLVDVGRIDMILVGDSVGMVVHGYDTTLPVTLDLMILHSKAVMRAVQRAYVVADLPFMSYQVSIEEAKRSAGRLLAEGGVDAVKLEGGQPMANTIRALVDIGIAVQAHIGLTPQSVSALGGFKVQGKSLEAARRLIADAEAVQEAGAFSVVLEGVPNRLAGLITERLHIPTIGIGAGSTCSGQVLVMHDVIGLTADHVPSFVKQYGSAATHISEALKQYYTEVSRGYFPQKDHEFTLSDEVWDTLRTDYSSTGG